MFRTPCTARCTPLPGSRGCSEEKSGGHHEACPWPCNLYIARRPSNLVSLRRLAASNLLLVDFERVAVLHVQLESWCQRRVQSLGTLETSGVLGGAGHQRPRRTVSGLS